MRILAVSDIHGNIENVRKLRNIERELTVVLGDFVEFGKPRVDVVIDILEELSSQTFTLYIPGNCDPPDVTQDLGVKNTVNIHGRFYKIDEIVFIGFGGSNPTPFNTPLEYPDAEIGPALERALHDAISKGALSRDEVSERLVVMTHAPPHETGLDLTKTGLHVGSISVRAFIEKYLPLLHLCGHIHEAQGVEKLNSTISVNVGALLWGRYAVVSLEEGRGVNIELRSVE